MGSCGALQYSAWRRGSVWRRKSGAPCSVAVQWVRTYCFDKASSWQHHSPRWGKKFWAERFCTWVLGYIPWQQNENLRREKWVPDGCRSWQKKTMLRLVLRKQSGDTRAGSGGRVVQIRLITRCIICGAIRGRVVRWSICYQTVVCRWWKCLCCCSAFTEGKNKVVSSHFPALAISLASVNCSVQDSCCFHQILGGLPLFFSCHKRSHGGQTWQ